MGRYSPTVIESGYNPLAEAIDRLSGSYTDTSENRRRRRLEDEERQRREQRDARQDKRQDAQDERQRGADALAKQIADFEFWKSGLRRGAQPVEESPAPQSPSLMSQFSDLGSLYDDVGVGQFPRERPRSDPGIPPQLAGLGDLFDRDSLDVGGFRGEQEAPGRMGFDEVAGEDDLPGLLRGVQDRGMGPKLPKPALPAAFVLGQGFNFNFPVTPSRYETVRPHRGDSPDEEGLYIDREATPEARQRAEEDSERERLATELAKVGGLTPRQIAALRAGATWPMVVALGKADTPRNIDPLSAEGIRAAIERERGVAPIRAANREGPDPDLQRNRRQETLSNLADEAIQAASGDIKQAAAILMDDPKTRDIFTQGLTMRHLNAAATRFRVGMGRPRTTGRSNMRDGRVVAGATATTPATGAVDQGRVGIALAEVRAGRASAADINGATGLSPEEKAEVLRQLGVR